MPRGRRCGTGWPPPGAEPPVHDLGRREVVAPVDRQRDPFDVGIGEAVAGQDLQRFGGEDAAAALSDHLMLAESLREAGHADEAATRAERAAKDPGLAVAPDWTLGLLFGIGGAAGMYCGARLQRRLPARAIKGMLVAVIVFVAAKYLLGIVEGFIDLPGFSTYRQDFNMNPLPCWQHGDTPERLLAQNSVNATCYDCHPGVETKCMRSAAHTAPAGNCETCHGPGKKHVADPRNATLIRGTMEKSICQQCHNAEAKPPVTNYTDAMYEEQRAKIAH